MNQTVIYYLTKKYNAPDFVKEASYSSLSSATSFLDKNTKEFPCHTKAATWLSAAKFYDSYYEYDEPQRYVLDAKLHKVAAIHGILLEVEKLKTEILGKQKDYDDDGVYGIVINKDGKKQKLFPLRNGEEIKVAAEWLNTNRKHLPWAYRNLMACKILKYAKNYNVRLNDDVKEVLRKVAGYGCCSKKDIMKLVKERLFLSENSKTFMKQASILKQAANVLGNYNKPLTRDVLVKVAKLIDNFDRTVGIDESVEDILFKFSKEDLKEIRDKLIHDKYSGYYYHEDQLGELPFNKLAIFGKKFLKNIVVGNVIDLSKMAQQIRNFGESKARLFSKLAREAKLQPVAVGKEESFSLL